MSSYKTQYSPQVFEKLFPKLFLRKYLEKDENPIRPCGRDLNEFRHIKFNNDTLSGTLGSSVVRKGDSLILCGITGSLTEAEGGLFPNITFSGKHGMPSSMEICLSEQIFEIIKTTKLINNKDLQIKDSSKSFVLNAYIDIICRTAPPLDHIWDALISALLNTKLPKTKILIDDPNSVICSSIESVPLKISSNYGWCSNFGIASFADKQYILADIDGVPEELSSDGLINIISQPNSDNLSYFSLSATNSNITLDDIKHCINLAKSHSKNIQNEYLQDSL